jgi:hypothetical protein
MEKLPEMGACLRNKIYSMTSDGHFMMRMLVTAEVVYRKQTNRCAFGTWDYLLNLDINPLKGIAVLIGRSAIY